MRCSEPKQPPRLSKVYRPTMADTVHRAEHTLRTGVALRCSEPVQPPCLGKVYRPAVALVVHAAEHALRTGIALLCSKHKLAPSELDVLTRVAHGVPARARAARRAAPTKKLRAWNARVKTACCPSRA